MTRLRAYVVDAWSIVRITVWLAVLAILSGWVLFLSTVIGADALVAVVRVALATLGFAVAGAVAFVLAALARAAVRGRR
ncbi:hypothetical protein [Nocardia sp. CC227C]|uniref:hypothetical protein n=1 Tax=Nocardia sp. CC227C TaxID=3044562 RepID=UPI00278C4B2F|nr:hypothetical protein [Nocardia sp. CC227C]